MNITEITDIIQAYSDALATTTEPTVFCCSKTLAVSTTKTVAGLVRETATLNGPLPVQIVDNPSAGLQKQVTNIVIHNRDTVTHTITVEFFDGTDAFLIHSVVLLTGEKASYAEGVWRKYTASGLEEFAPTPGSTGTLFNSQYVLNGMLYENINRNLCQEVNTSLLSTGRLSLEAIYLPAATVVSSISFWSATTAANVPTNQLFGLFDQNRNLLRSTNNDTTTAWASNSLKTLALTSSYTTTYSGLHYLGIMVTATTVPTIKGFTASTGGQLANAAPSLRGTSNTGLTTALPSTANAPAAVTTSAWCSVG